MKPFSSSYSTSTDALEKVRERPAAVVGEMKATGINSHSVLDRPILTC